MHYVALSIAKAIKDDLATELDSFIEDGLGPHPVIRARSQYAARVAADGLSAVLGQGFDRIEFYAACGV